MTTVVDHTRAHASIHDLTVQGSQAARARAVMHLTENHNLPTVSNWSIDSETQPLIGLIWADYRQGAEQQREKVARWAEFLHAAVTEISVAGRTELSAEGWAYGVLVRIQAPLRAPAKEAA
jgi:hypothetical protein